MQLGYLMEQHIFTLNKHSGMLICFSLVVCAFLSIYGIIFTLNVMEVAQIHGFYI